MTLLLPGVGVTYIGDEIAMENTWISWENTQDPQGCNAKINGYEKASRDPERSPFQWDNSTAAGKSTTSLFVQRILYDAYEKVYKSITLYCRIFY